MKLDQTQKNLNIYSLGRVDLLKDQAETLTEGVDLKAKIFDAIMTDDMRTARSLVAQQPENFRFIADLLEQIAYKPSPLAQLQSDYTAWIQFPTTFTCNIGCPMCIAGFQDKTFLVPEFRS